MSNILDLDLDLDEEETEKSVQGGLEQGVKKGLKKGISDGVAPLAQKAGEEAIKNMMGGGNSQVQGVLKDVGDAMRVQALQQTLNQMKSSPPPQAQQPQSSAQQSGEFLNMLKTMSALGMNPNELVQQMGVNNVMGLMNPSLLPYLTMMQNKTQPQAQGNSSSDIMPMLMMMMQNQNKPQSQTESTGAPSMLTVLMQQQAQQQQAQQALMNQIFEMQQANAQLQQQNIMEQMKPYLQPQPTFADQMAQLQNQMSGLKQIGLIGDPEGPKTDRALDLDFEAKKMAIGLERDKMQFDREMLLEQRRLESKEKENNMFMQMFETGQNLLKNLQINKNPSRRYGPRTQEELPQQTTPRSVEPSDTLNDRISNRISNMLKIHTPQDEESNDE